MSQAPPPSYEEALRYTTDAALLDESEAALLSNPPEFTFMPVASPLPFTESDGAVPPPGAAPMAMATPINPNNADFRDLPRVQRRVPYTLTSLQKVLVAPYYQLGVCIVAIAASVFAWYVFQLSRENEYESLSSPKIFLQCCDVFFVAVIYMNMRTPCVRNGIHISDQKVIARHYLRRWFVVDMIGIMGDTMFELVINSTEMENDNLIYSPLFNFLFLRYVITMPTERWFLWCKGNGGRRDDNNLLAVV